MDPSGTCPRSLELHLPPQFLHQVSHCRRALRTDSRHHLQRCDRRPPRSQKKTRLHFPHHHTLPLSQSLCRWASSFFIAS